MYTENGEIKIFQMPLLLAVSKAAVKGWQDEETGKKRRLLQLCP
jgi:hypothetical protein